MKFLTVVIIGFVFSVFNAGSVYAEIGQNFDREQIGPNQFVWTSHYDRIWDGDSWVNYILNEDATTITFESAQMNYKFEKNSCSFSLFDPITKESSIQDFSHDLTIDGIKVLVTSCIITNLVPTNDSASFKVTRTADGGELVIIYQIKAAGEMEWIYEIKNTDLFKIATVGVIETCTNCQSLKTEGDLIYFEDYFLDTKNIIHNTLKTIEADKGNLNLTYESEPISYFDKVIIDPVFAYTTGTDFEVDTTSGTGASCPAPSTKTSALAIEIEIISSADGAGTCKIVASRWDISSIPDGGIVNDTSIRYDVEGVSSPRNCTWREINTDPSTASATDLWNDILDGTAFVTNNSGCITASDNKILDLGTSADADVMAQLSANWWAVGISFNSMSRDGGAYYIALDQTSENKQIELQVTYNYQALNAYPEVITTNVIGDKVKITGNMYVNSLPFGNITSQKLFVNGTLSQHNQTIHHGTNTEYRVNFGPYWYRMATDSVYNFTMQIQANQYPSTTVTNQSSIFKTREYGPQYFTAEVPAQGKYNYTFNDGLFKVNRNVTGVLNETFQIECFFQNWALVAFNSTSGDWLNETNTGYYIQQEPDINPNFNYLISCYNDDLLFSDTVYTDGPLALLGIGSLDATYASYLGVPVGVLFIVMAASLASQRNAPIWIVIILAIAGVMATIGFFTIEPLVWALALIAGLLGLFVGRKLF